VTAGFLVLVFEVSIRIATTTKNTRMALSDQLKLAASR
jgi:hypothetical protein